MTCCRLVGVVGGTPATWRKALGTIELHPLATHPASNWSLALVGNAKQRDAIRLAEAVIREEHPYVDRD